MSDLDVIEVNETFRGSGVGGRMTMCIGDGQGIAAISNAVKGMAKTH